MNLLAIDLMRRKEVIQAHHWQAARWFAEHARFDLRTVATIQGECRQLEIASACYGIDTYALLHKAVVSREAIAQSEKVIGVLREVLNVVDRIKRRTGGDVPACAIEANQSDWGWKHVIETQKESAALRAARQAWRERTHTGADSPGLGG